MATYGKKKLGIFSKSAEFLDDKSKAPGEDSPGKASCIVLYLDEYLTSSAKVIHGLANSSRLLKLPGVGPGIKVLMGSQRTLY